MKARIPSASTSPSPTRRGLRRTERATAGEPEHSSRASSSRPKAGRFAIGETTSLALVRTSPGLGPAPDTRAVSTTPSHTLATRPCDGGTDGDGVTQDADRGEPTYRRFSDMLRAIRTKRQNERETSQIAQMTDDWLKAQTSANGEGEDAWLRMPHEPHAYFELFACYRDTPPALRTVRSTARTMGKAHKACQLIATEYRWRARADLWDKRVEADRAEASRLAVLDMGERQATLGKTMVEKAQAAADILDPHAMDAYQVAAVAQAGVKVERLARGASTENTAGKVDGRFIVELGGVY